MTKVEEIKCKHLVYWPGKHGIELSNSWDMSADGQKKLENFVKTNSNELMAM